MKQSQDSMGQIFALASDCDAMQLDLTAAEGYLLSRFDGATPWRVLREISGVPVDEADTCLARWVEAGLLEFIRDVEESTSTAPSEEAESPSADADAIDADQVSAEPPPAPQIDETQIDEELEIGVEVQRRILEFEARLDEPYHSLLDVPKGSDPKVVKHAYFKRSKEFHPDRFFRKEIGSYAKRLERIFKKILEAHEMLSDPDLCQVENQVSSTPVVPAAETPPASESTAPKPSKPLTKLERLRQRMPFKITQAAIESRRRKAMEIFRAAKVSIAAGRLSEAEVNLRIAISFDAARPEFKEALGDIRIQAAGASATKLLAKPSERMSNEELRDAFKLLEDVLIYRPHDPELNERAARVCLQLGKFDLAKEYAETLIDRTPDVAAAYTLLGRIHRELDDLEAAMRVFETALKLDENDSEAQRALASLRIGAREKAQGGAA